MSLSAKQETIYGIDVFTFRDSYNNPFQLTFQDHISEKYKVASLIHLLGKNDSEFCPDLRKAICEWIYQYMVEKNCTVYFDIELSSKKNQLLFLKFLRWITIDSRVIANADVTVFDDVKYIEFKLNVNANYKKQIVVK